ncbi:ankyrin repeat protein [Saonia flava]|uniref:Ankyrin repeat protein n=1 Tax=Saonia flava TaxID=523696 RepID=A0A846R059_9FLAO|nr:ankyrin repeat domain-containing protein [Saonia flava]NJB70754.1 ankyrin repeat protein [Saonia flava]
MKKTILTVTAAFMLAATGICAESKEDVTNVTENLTSLTSVDINSFCKAIMKGDIDTVRKLIDLGEDVNQKSLGKTPAIFAARYNRAEILQLLIENGANLKTKCDKGYTVKKYAEMSNANEVLALLETVKKK